MAYEQAKLMLEAFKQANPQFFERLYEFLEDYNQKREAAEKAVRAAGVKCGDFDLYQQLEKVDGEKVLNAVGREKFIAMGGSFKFISGAKLNIKQLQAALARGEIDQALYDECVKVENRYHVPSGGGMP